MRDFLIRPIRYQAVAKYLSKILIILAALQLAPIAVSIIYQEFSLTVIYLILTLFIFTIGYFGDKKLPDFDLDIKEALVLASFIYFILSLIMATVWTFAGLPFLDALFEAMSAATTTGLSTLPIESLSQTMLFTRSFVQWIGGLSIVVLTISVLIGPGTTAYRLFTVSIGETKVSPSAIKATKILWRAYAIITATCMLAFYLSGMDLFQAGCQAMATISTGGFATEKESFAAFSSAAIIFCSLFMVIGATNLNMFHPLNKAHLNIFKDTQWRVLIICIAVLMFIFFLGMIETCSWKEAIYKSFFQTVSAQSTSGFSTMDFAKAPALSKLSAIFSMSIGGSIGSTAGGIKIYRLVIFIKLLYILVIRIHQPKEVITHLRVNNIALSREDIEAAIVSITLFFLTVLVSVTFFVGAGYNFLDSLFEVVSATGTVGLSTGICSPDLSEHLKIILFFDMWMGRLEIFPFLILIYPRTWVKRRM